MNPGGLDDIADQLAKARELGDAEREAFLLELESRNSALAAEVRRLLASQALASNFLDPPKEAAVEGPLRMLSLDFRGLKLGDFELVREIGRGASGVVYVGEQRSLNRQVAIKILVPQLTAIARVQERFEREARAASRLRHPAIVSVLGAGELQGVLYIAMEYVEGKSLHQHLEGLRQTRKRHLPPNAGTLDVSKPEIAAELTAQLADALQYCHGEGVLHRDIKPQNILIDKDGKPRIVDFGLAKDVRIERITEPGLVSGTLQYMSPEQAQARSDELDARSDIYSLGVVLYEMLTLRCPFEGNSDAELLRQVLNARPIPPHHIDERIPRSLSVICMRALRKSPEGRYEDAAEFIQDLRAFLAGGRIALGARLRFEDAYRYVFLKRPWIGVTGLVVLFSTAVVLAPKALNSTELHAASSIQQLKDPSQRLSARFRPKPGETAEDRARRIKAELEVARILREMTEDTSTASDKK